MLTSSLALCAKRVIPCILLTGLLAAAPIPTHKPIKIGVFYTPKVASTFGGSAGVGSLAKVEIEDQINEALAASDLSPSEGYRVEVVMLPLPSTLSAIDAAEICDFNRINARFIGDKAVAVRRNRAKVSMVWLLVQCRDPDRWGLGTTPLYPEDYKSPGVGFVVIRAGALYNLVASHEFAHFGTGHHPNFEADDDAPSTTVLRNRRGKPIVSPYIGYSQGVNLPAVDDAKAPRSCALGIHGNPGNFFSHPGTDAWGRKTGDATHDVARGIRTNWDLMAAMGDIVWKPPLR